MNDDHGMQLTRIEQLLEDNLEATQENNERIRSMQRAAKWGFWLKVVVWAAVIILPFLLLKPLLQTLVPATGGGNGLFGFPSQADLEKALNSYQGQ
jgi:hypothetical protein